jgi:hypothetical protein
LPWIYRLRLKRSKRMRPYPTISQTVNAIVFLYASLSHLVLSILEILNLNDQNVWMRYAIFQTRTIDRF